MLAADGGGQVGNLSPAPLELLVFRCEVGEATKNAAGAGVTVKTVKDEPMGDDQTPKR